MIRVPLSTSLPSRLKINEASQHRFDTHPITVAARAKAAKR